MDKSSTDGCQLRTALGAFARLGGATPISGNDFTPKAYVDTAVSDSRLKENVVNIESTSKFDYLRPVNFDWIESETEHINQNCNGFIAQEVEEVYPEMVSMVDE